MEGQSRARMQLSRDPGFSRLMQSLKSKIGNKPSSTTQLNSSIYCPPSTQQGTFFYSHPKLKKLEEVVLSHFQSFQEGNSRSEGHRSKVGGATTRVIIFSQYRESVREIADMLGQHSPLVKVMSFMGHSSAGKATKGQTQREQIEVNMLINI